MPINAYDSNNELMTMPNLPIRGISVPGGWQVLALFFIYQMNWRNLGMDMTVTSWQRGHHKHCHQHYYRLLL